MSHSPNTNRKTKEILTSVCAALALCAVVFVTQTDSILAQSSNFQGGSPVVSQAPDMTSIRILFPAGVRSSWHTHTWGQLLMIEDGVGMHQTRGGPIYEQRPGEPWWTGPDIEHWHGAHPDMDAHQLTIYEGSVVWLDPVTDDQYNGMRMRP
tara:strand:- start:87 stop:542 length:456 start_codon:yes stop_codon:yes gene_type:complete